MQQEQHDDKARCDPSFLTRLSNLLVSSLCSCLLKLKGRLRLVLAFSSCDSLLPPIIECEDSLPDQITAGEDDYWRERQDDEALEIHSHGRLFLAFLFS